MLDRRDNRGRLENQARFANKRLAHAVRDEKHAPDVWPVPRRCAGPEEPGDVPCAVEVGERAGLNATREKGVLAWFG